MTNLEFLEKIHEVGIKRKWFKNSLSWGTFECHCTLIGIKKYSKMNGIVIFRENFKKYETFIKKNDEQNIFKLDDFLVEKIIELIPDGKNLEIVMVEKTNKNDNFTRCFYKRIHRV